MYAIVRTGGKQYRVERGQTLLVERLPVKEGQTCTLEPLLYVDGDQVLDRGQDGAEVTVEARVVAHERGPKLRVVKFKPKRGYKRRTGHRQDLTRIEITAIETGGRPRRGGAGRDATGTGGTSGGQLSRGSREPRRGAEQREDQAPAAAAPTAPAAQAESHAEGEETSSALQTAPEESSPGPVEPKEESDGS